MEMMIAWGLSRIRELNGIWCRIRWLRVHFLKLLLVATSAAITFAFLSIPSGDYLAFLSKLSNYGVLFETVAVVTIAFSGITFWARQRVALVLERLAPLGVEAISPNRDELFSKCGEQAIVYNAAVNALLNGASNPIKFSSDRFEVHPLIREMLPRFVIGMPEVGLDTADDAKVRLLTDVSEDVLKRGAVIYLQETSYYCDRLSNTLANYRVRLDGREILNLRPEVVDVEGKLVSLRESQLSNQLGASTLLVTSDSTIVYLRQGNRVRENAGRLAPAGSGSFDFPSVRLWENRSFQDLAREEARRELCEECGLASEDLLSVQICGFGRYLYRNGKPEVFCIATTYRDSHSIKVPLREWDFQQRKVEACGFEGRPNAANVGRGLDELRLRLEGRGPGYDQVSGPLYWAVVFARDYLAQVDQDAEVALFGSLA